jgi:hypothetical protein
VHVAVNIGGKTLGSLRKPTSSSFIHIKKEQQLNRVKILGKYQTAKCPHYILEREEKCKI